MYRLLIIDDEPYIVDWVYELFQQNQELDLDIYRAYSGVEALSFLKRAKIDIVMTDINMPEMNGLQLLKEINNSWPLCKVIFLTAYNEFEYAHIANKSGVTYLLKTESDAEIVKAVEKAVNEIDNFIRQEELIKNAKRQMEMALPIMQREYLMEKLKGNDLFQISQNQLDELGINLVENDELLLLIGRTDNWFLSRKSNDKAKQSAIIQAITQSFFSTVLKYAYLQLDNSIMVWLIQPQKYAGEGVSPADFWDKTIVYVEGTLDSIQDQCKKSLETSISFVIDSKPCSWKMLSHRFLSLAMLMNNGGIKNRDMILTKEYTSDGDTEQSEQYTCCLQQVKFWNDKMHTLEAFLESGEHKEFYSLFIEFKENLVPIIKTHSNLRSEVYFSTSLLFLNYINRYETLLEKLATYPELTSLMNINCNMHCEEVFESFEKIADMIFIYQKVDREKKNMKLVASINEYIQNNLDKDVSLIKLAEQVYLNPSYLSRVYKQIAGVNISDYIFSIRLNKAKKMLMESNLKVHEIANSVGFDSAAYFIRAFKKSAGITPQEYREHTLKFK